MHTKSLGVMVCLINQKLILGYHGYRLIHSLMFSISHPGFFLSFPIDLPNPGTVLIHRTTQDVLDIGIPGLPVLAVCSKAWWCVVALQHNGFKIFFFNKSKQHYFCIFSQTVSHKHVLRKPNKTKSPILKQTWYRKYQLWWLYFHEVNNLETLSRWEVL